MKDNNIQAKDYNIGKPLFFLGFLLSFIVTLLMFLPYYKLTIKQSEDGFKTFYLSFFSSVYGIIFIILIIVIFYILINNYIKYNGKKKKIVISYTWILINSFFLLLGPLFISVYLDKYTDKIRPWPNIDNSISFSLYPISAILLFIFSIKVLLVIKKKLSIKKNYNLNQIVFFGVNCIILIFFLFYSNVRPLGCYGNEPTICFDNFNRFQDSYFDGEIGTKGFYLYNPFNKHLSFFYSWDDDLKFLDGKFFEYGNMPLKMLNKNILEYNNNIKVTNDYKKRKSSSKISIDNVYESSEGIYYFYNSNIVIMHYSNDLNRLLYMNQYDLSNNYYLFEIADKESVYDSLIYNLETKNFYKARVYNGPVTFDSNLINRAINSKKNWSITFVSNKINNFKIEIKDDKYIYNGKSYELQLSYFDKEYLYYKLVNNYYLRSDYNASNLELVEKNGESFISSDYYKEK